MKRRRIDICLTLENRRHLETILHSTTSTQNDKLKAQVLLLTDVGEYGPKVLSQDVVTQLNISDRSVKRIRHAYAKNLSLEDVFRFAGFSKKNSAKVQTSKPSKQKNIKYIEIDSSTNESFLVEHVKYRVTLSKEEREKLHRIIKQGKQSTRKFNRAKILLLADEGSDGPGMDDQEIVNKLGVSLSSVARVRTLLITKGRVEDVLNFNHDKAGRLPKIDGKIQAALIAQACGKPPEGFCRWTLKLLADRLVELEVIETISHTAVGNALKKMNLNLGNEKSG